MNIKNTSQLIELLEEERQIKQIHLLLLSEDTSGPSYDTESEPKEELEPPKPTKGKKPTVTKKKGGRGNAKKIKQEIKEEVVEKEDKNKIKVCYTTIQVY